MNAFYSTLLLWKSEDWRHQVRVITFCLIWDTVSQLTLHSWLAGLWVSEDSPVSMSHLPLVSEDYTCAPPCPAVCDFQELNSDLLACDTGYLHFSILCSHHCLLGIIFSFLHFSVTHLEQFVKMSNYVCSLVSISFCIHQLLFHKPVKLQCELKVHFVMYSIFCWIISAVFWLVPCRLVEEIILSCCKTKTTLLEHSMPQKCIDGQYLPYLISLCALNSGRYTKQLLSYLCWIKSHCIFFAPILDGFNCTAVVKNSVCPTGVLHLLSKQTNSSHSPFT